MIEIGSGREGIDLPVFLERVLRLFCSKSISEMVRRSISPERRPVVIARSTRTYQHSDFTRADTSRSRICAEFSGFG